MKEGFENYNGVYLIGEIGQFVKSIVENNIKYLTGATINFDGGLSNSLF
jgi:hypothetical protein